MKTIFVILILIFFCLPDFGQSRNINEEGISHLSLTTKGKKECDSRVQLADSAVYYVYNEDLNIYEASQVRIYHYDSYYRLVEVILKNLPARSNVYRQIFEYDSDGNQLRYNYFNWTSKEWSLSLYVLKEVDINDLLKEEVYYRKDQQGQWESYMHHFYTNENGRNLTYLRRLLNGYSEWYDFSRHYFIYDSFGRLVTLYGQYINDGPIYWHRTFIYNDDSMLAERILKGLKYNKELRINQLMNNERQVYKYNIFGNADTINLYDWIDENWSLAGRSVGYFSTIKNKRVGICYKGQSICVAADAVEAYLKRGASLGECSEASYELNSQKDEPFRIYPNPSTSKITILIKDENLYTRGFVVSSDGSVLIDFQVIDCSGINLNVASFKKGIYWVRLVSNSGIQSKSFIKN
jgi:hypothetical protein